MFPSLTPTNGAKTMPQHSTPFFATAVELSPPPRNSSTASYFIDFSIRLWCPCLWSESCLRYGDTTMFTTYGTSWLMARYAVSKSIACGAAASNHHSLITLQPLLQKQERSRLVGAVNYNSCSSTKILTDPISDD